MSQLPCFIFKGGWGYLVSVTKVSRDVLCGGCFGKNREILKSNRYQNHSSMGFSDIGDNLKLRRRCDDSLYKLL